MKNLEGKTVITDLTIEQTSFVMKMIRKSRVGKVRRYGQKGHRIYVVEPRNREEMTLEARRLMDLTGS